jgi:hypothetical protein
MAPKTPTIQCVRRLAAIIANPKAATIGQPFEAGIGTADAFVSGSTRFLSLGQRPMM